jgi:uncharacterized membrane protein
METKYKSHYIDFPSPGPIGYGLMIFWVILIVGFILLYVYKPSISGFTGCDISKYSEQCLAKSLPYYNPTV